MEHGEIMLVRTLFKGTRKYYFLIPLYPFLKLFLVKNMRMNNIINYYFFMLIKSVMVALLITTNKHFYNVFDAF